MFIFQSSFGEISTKKQEPETVSKTVSMKSGNMQISIDTATYQGKLTDASGKTIVEGDVRKESFWNEVKKVTSIDVYNELRRWADEVMRLIQTTFKAKGGTNMGIWAERISIFFKKRDEEEQRKTEGVEKGKESVLEETSIGSKKEKAA